MSASAVDILASSDVFARCSGRDVRHIATFTSNLTFESKQWVFRDGDDSRSLYILADGMLKLTRTTGAGQEAVLDFVNPGASICPHAVFTQRPFQVSARALQPSTVLAIDMTPLRKFIQSKPYLSWDLAATISNRVDTLTDRLVSFASLNAEQRAAALLLDQFDKRTGRRGPKQTDMANLLAISPETLCRLLARFRRRGWIANSDGQVVIVDPNGLRSVLPGAASTSMRR